MRVPLLFLLAILTPVLLCATLLVPSYASILGATYIVYDPGKGGIHPLGGKWLDVSEITSTFFNLLDFWSNHYQTLSFVDYTLPILGLPLLGAAAALWLTTITVKKLFNLFHLSATIH